MKSIFTFLLIVGLFANTLAQETPPQPKQPTPPKVLEEKTAEKIYSYREVDLTAIYPGCEKVISDTLNLTQNNINLSKCLSKSLNKSLSAELDGNDLNEYAVENQLTKLRAKLIFIIDENGDITDIKTGVHSNDYMGEQAKKALSKVAIKLKTQGGIKPAIQEGKAVKMKYTVPVFFRSM